MIFSSTFLLKILSIKVIPLFCIVQPFLRITWGPFCVSSQSPPHQFSILRVISESHFTAVCEETSPVTPDFFFQAFAKNSLIDNIFEEEKKFDSRTWFFGENSSVLGVFWPRRGLKANHGTVRKSAILPQPDNQKRLKWSNTTCVNKKSFTFAIKLCVFQVTKTFFCMKVIQIFNA